MKLYSVLFVDDEEEVFQVIMKKLDWEAMGFRVAGYARNGVEALEMAEELQVDVVMTDIQMSYMDGLTLCKKLKELYERIKLIIFSGYDEFEYAKEAIKMEVEEYILKPINANELRDVFLRIKTNLDRELDEKRNIEKLQEYYLDSLPILQESFLTSLLEGSVEESRIEKYVINYQLKMKGPYYVVSVVHIGSLENEGKDAAMSPFLLALSVKKMTEEQLSGHFMSRTVNYLGDIIVITQLESPDGITDFTNTMDKLCDLQNRIHGVKVTAGIGHVCSQLSQLPLSYQGAKSAISYRVLYSNTRAINIAEIEPQENINVPWEEPYLEKIIKMIKMGEKETLEEAICNFTTQIGRSKMSLPDYQLLIMKLLTEIFRFGSNNQINMESSFGRGVDVYNQALGLESIEELGEWLIVRCTRLQEQVKNQRRNTTKSFVAKAIDYVKEHYADQDLSIETICSYLGVSTAYFSTVFKKETGKTFINYLTEYRMQQAVELLIEKNEKTYIIAQQVGYADPNYFSYVFKKQYGMSPSKYKSSRQE